MSTLAKAIAPKIYNSSTSLTVDERIQLMEVKYDLLQHQVDGWCVWPVLRFPVALTLLNLPFVKKDPFRLRELLFIAAKDAPRFIFPRKSSYAVVTYSSARAEQENGLYKDVFFDDLLRDIGSFFKIEKLNTKAFIHQSNNALIKSDISSTLIDLLLGFVFSRIKTPSTVLAVAKNLSKSLREEEGLESFTDEKVAGYLSNFYWRKRIYKWLFSRIAPKYLFLADGYSEHDIIAAAKEQGVKVFEFQHGGFCQGGPEYSWFAHAIAYKPKMPIPDRFLLYGDYWQQELDSDGFWGENLLPVGSIRLDQYRKRRSLHRNKDSICRIILTTQGMHTSKLIEFISTFLKLCDKRIAVEFCIKLHPAYETNKEEYLKYLGKDERIKIFLGSEPPSTFELLCNADLHLSISSTCHYDALGLGVPTVILPFENANIDWVLPLYQKGHAFLANSPQELLNLVLRWKDIKVPASVINFYFKTGALENIKAEFGL
jgi:hypothetical protein